MTYPPAPRSRRTPGGELLDEGIDAGSHHPAVPADLEESSSPERTSCQILVSLMLMITATCATVYSFTPDAALMFIVPDPFPGLHRAVTRRGWPATPCHALQRRARQYTGAELVLSNADINKPA